MRLRWSRRSVDHLADIRRYIGQHNPDVAEHVRLRIVETIKLLQSLPRLGHGGRKEGTREFGVPGLPYLIVYRIDMGDDDEIVILGIVHGAQAGTPLFTLGACRKEGRPRLGQGGQLLKQVRTCHGRSASVCAKI